MSTELPPDAVQKGIEPGLTADELRHKLVENFELNKPVLQKYYEYAASAAALAQEYHAARFRECFKTSETKELTLVAEFDSRETPATLDRKLAELGSLLIKEVIYDRIKNKYYLFA